MLNGKLKSSMLNGNALSICMLTLITLEEGGEGGKEWYYWINYSRLNSTVLINHIKGVGKKPPQILSSCYYVYKQLPQKDVQLLLL